MVLTSHLLPVKLITTSITLSGVNELERVPSQNPWVLETIYCNTFFPISFVDKTVNSADDLMIFGKRQKTILGIYRKS